MAMLSLMSQLERPALPLLLLFWLSSSLLSLARAGSESMSSWLRRKRTGTRSLVFGLSEQLASSRRAMSCKQNGSLELTEKGNGARDAFSSVNSVR